MTNATINYNDEHNGIEITFDGKPSEEIRNELKAAGFRWHNARRVWYAKNTEQRREIAERLTDGKQTTTAGEGRTRATGKPTKPDQDHIRIYYNGIKIDGGKLIKCRYSLNESGEAVTIYADSYGADLPRDLLPVKNESDLYTDYFEKDSATITAAHPLYKYFRFAAYLAAIRSDRRHVAHIEKRIATPGTWEARNPDRYRADIERIAERVARYEQDAGNDPGQPTAEDLAEIDRARQAAENAAREAEHRAELERREAYLRERSEGRLYVESILAAYPIEDGAPVVAIPWSESPALASWIDSIDKTATTIIVNEDGTQDKQTEIIEPRRELLLSVRAAEIILTHFDEAKHAKREGYDKTDFVITYTDEAGERSTYEGRYDLGDLDGGLIAHIRALAEWDATHDEWGHPSETRREISESRFEWVKLLEKYNREPAEAEALTV